MSELHVIPQETPEGYDRRYRMLHRRPVKYTLSDGWVLEADNLKDAIKEAGLMGEPAKKIIPAH